MEAAAGRYREANAHHLQAREPLSVVFLVLAAAACLAVGAVYTWTFGLPLPRFWEGKLYDYEVGPMSLVSGAILLAQGVALSLAMRPARPRSLEAILEFAVARRRRAAAAAWLVASLMSAAYAWLRVTHNVEYGHAPLDLLMRGEAWAPYQYRVLVPFLVGMTGVDGTLGEPSVRLAFGLVEFGSALLLVAVTAALCRRFMDRHTAMLVAPLILVPLALTLATPFRANPYFYPWDTPSVLFMAAGILLVFQRRWWVYYPLFLLATVNRETTCFLTIFYLLAAVGQEPTRRIAGHVTAQVLLWFAVKLALVAIYPDLRLEDRGAAPFVAQPLFVSMAGRNLAFLVNPLSYPYLVHAAGGLWVALVLHGRRIPDPEVRRGLLVAVPFLAAMGYVGLLGEIRIFAELIPLFFLGHVLMLASVRRHPQASAEAALTPASSTAAVA